jgi:hypothetical protein
VEGIDLGSIVSLYRTTMLVRFLITMRDVPRLLKQQKG